MTRFVVAVSLAAVVLGAGIAEAGPVVHEGAYSAKIEWVAGESAPTFRLVKSATNYINVADRQDHDLKMKVWARSEGGETGFTLRLTFHDDSLAKLGQKTSATKSATEEWKLVSMSKSVRSDAIYANVVVIPAAVGAAVIDEIVLEDLGPTGANWPTPEVLTVSNAGFEVWPGDVLSTPSDWEVWEPLDTTAQVSRIEIPPDTPTPSSGVDGALTSYE